MRDYEELLKRLRDSADWADHFAVLMGRDGDVHTPIMREAADAIEELQAYADLYKELTEKKQTVARKLIDAYPRWISVEERLPDVKKEVIVCDKMPNGMRYVTTAFMLEDCAFLNDCGRMYEVTHWMPLPEPPKEDA